MHKIAVVLALALLSAASAWSAESGPVTATPLLTSTTSWDGTPLPAYPAGQPQITIARVQIAPGASLPPHMHRNTIAAGVLLQGQLTVVTDSGATLELAAGDAVIETVNTWHSGRNTGFGPVELIVFYAGIQGQAITEARQ